MKLRHILASSLLVLPLVACSDGHGDDTPPDVKPPIVVPPKDDVRVVINEVTSSGEDMVEFYNLGDKDVDIEGWYYMDSKLDLTTAYTFEKGASIPAGGYLVVSKAQHHSFGLGAADGVALFFPDGSAVDAVVWEDGKADVSWCRLPNGTGEFQVCPRPTFGAANTSDEAACGNGIAEAPSEVCDAEDLAGATCASHGFSGGVLRCATDCATFDTSACSGRISTIVVNEVTSSGSDNIELFNNGTAAVDISGWKLTDDNRVREDAYVFDEGTVLAPGAYLVLTNPEDFGFGIGKADAVNLFDATGELMDHTAWPSGDAEVSWCRQPNGLGDFRVCSAATFGAANVDDSVEGPEPVCGDGVIEGDELCDGTNLDGATCADFALVDGTLSCAADCLSLVTTACEPSVASVVINEVTSAGSDDIELFNRGNVAMDLSGWKVTDDNTERVDAYIFAEGTTLAPGAYLVLKNPDDFAFGIGKVDAVNLFDAAGELVDTTTWADGQAAISWCRQPNGTGDFGSCSAPSFGAANP